MTQKRGDRALPQGAPLPQEGLSGTFRWHSGSPRLSTPSRSSGGTSARGGSQWVNAPPVTLIPDAKRRRSSTRGSIRRSLVCSPSENPAYSRVCRSRGPMESRGASRSFTIHSMRFHRDRHLQAKRWSDPRTLSQPSAERSGLSSRRSPDSESCRGGGPESGRRAGGQAPAPGQAAMLGCDPRCVLLIGTLTLRQASRRGETYGQQGKSRRRSSRQGVCASSRR